MGPWYWLWMVFYLTLSLQVKLSSLNFVCAYIAVLFLEILIGSKFENREWLHAIFKNFVEKYLVGHTEAGLILGLCPANERRR